MAAPEECHCHKGGSLPDIPIAIVGVACRLAGSATSPEALWQMLSRGKSGWSRGAGARFNLAAFHHPSAEVNGAVSEGAKSSPAHPAHQDCNVAYLSPVQCSRHSSSKTRHLAIR